MHYLKNEKSEHLILIVFKLGGRHFFLES